MNRIRELRKINVITQMELCRELDISQGTLSLWENGICEPDHKSLLRLRDFFNVSVDYLLGFTDDPEIIGNPVSAAELFDLEAAQRLVPNEVMIMARDLQKLDPNDFELLKIIIAGMLNRKGS